ncbi:hypothetical protein LV564_07520 [Komagataeibacter nataicola]|uniref:hypothetical protein n=1 Tax=Komagataeibacter nataicola TaxID=265960 RepID=UPI0023DD56E1|nr:hypothetical protein [Komagataeibacter nataicola]WEQ57444.1 hypothetical protein LV564_07520 [Komagataeibacter nataicola]
MKKRTLSGQVADNRIAGKVSGPAIGMKFILVEQHCFLLLRLVATLSSHLGQAFTAIVPGNHMLLPQGQACPGPDKQSLFPLPLYSAMMDWEYEPDRANAATAPAAPMKDRS